MSLAKPVLFQAHQEEGLQGEVGTKGSGGVVGVPQLKTKDNYVFLVGLL